MTKRVLLILDKMIRAGTQRHILHMLKGMPPEWKFHVVCLEGRGPWDHEVCRRGGLLHHYALNRIYDLSGLQTLLGLKKLIQSIRPAGIETFMFTAHIIGAAAASLLPYRIPVISSRREKILWRKESHFYLRRKANQAIIHHVANSNAVKKDLERTESVDPEEVTVIPNALDWDDYQASSHITIDPHKINVAVAAALKPVKQHHLILEMARRFKSEMNDVVFHLLGGGPEEKKLREKVKKWNLEDKIIFHGFVDPLAPCLSQFDFCILPSLSEGLSNSLIEQMGAGLAAVAFDVDGNKEVICSGVTGFLIEKNNLNKMAEAVIRLSKEPDLRQKLGQKACEDMRNRYSIDTMCSLKSNIYKRFFHN